MNLLPHLMVGRRNVQIGRRNVLISQGKLAPAPVDEQIESIDRQMSAIKGFFIGLGAVVLTLAIICAVIIWGAK